MTSSTQATAWSSLGRLRGRAKASGRDFEVEFVHVWTMTDGVASRLRAYFDTAPIMAALDQAGDEPAT